MVSYGFLHVEVKICSEVSEYHTASILSVSESDLGGLLQLLRHPPEPNAVNMQMEAEGSSEASEISGHKYLKRPSVSNIKHKNININLDQTVGLQRITRIKSFLSMFPSDVVGIFKTSLLCDPLFRLYFYVPCPFNSCSNKVVRIFYDFVAT